jgi:exonuclease III
LFTYFHLLLTAFDYSIVASIGSIQLDTAFEDSVRQRLCQANQILHLGFESPELDLISWKMAKEREYQNAKSKYGSWDDETEFFTVNVPGLRLDYVNQSAWIANGAMRLRR